jgi:DNA-binding protein HU-beta
VQQLNKGELAAKIAEKTSTSKKAAEAALNAFTETVAEALQSGNKVSVLGFGTFEARARGERTGKNPRTGAEILIPATTAPVFKAGKALKELVK